MHDDINSLSLGALRKEANRLNKAIVDAEDIAKNDPEAVKAKKTADAALAAYRDLLNRKAEKLSVPLLEREREVNRRIKEITSQKRDESLPPPHIQQIFLRFKAGVDYGSKPFQCRWVSPTGRFFIMTNPGSCFWANMMEPRKYGKTEHYLMDCAKVPPEPKDNSRENSQHGFDLFNNAQVRSIEGRLAKETKAEWIRLALEIEGMSGQGYIQQGCKVVAAFS